MPNKIKQFSGLNTRMNDLDGVGDDATDMRNVYKDKHGVLRKRGGTLLQSNNFSEKGLVQYLQAPELVGFNASGLKRWSGLAASAITNAGANDYVATNFPASAERLGNLYLGNGVNELLKYDGLAWYRAGAPGTVPRTVFNVSNDATHPPLTTSTYIQALVQFVSTDRNDNVTFGDVEVLEDQLIQLWALTHREIDIEFFVPGQKYSTYAGSNKWAQNTAYIAAPPSYVFAPDNNFYHALTAHTSSTGGTALADFKKDLQLGRWRLVWENQIGFSKKNAVVNGDQFLVNTFNVLSGHTIEAGDKIFVTPSAAFAQEMAVATRTGTVVPTWEYWRAVTSITATSITFTGDPSDFINGTPITSNLTVLIYVREVDASGNALEDWRLIKEAAVQSDGFRQTESAVVYDDVAATQPVNLGPIQDSDLVRENAPVAKYVSFFQDLMFVVPAADPNTLNWSIPGESVEVFNIGTYGLRVGDKNDGIITGINSFNDYFVVFCERAVFYISGTFELNQIRVWRLDGAEAGCSSHFSVQRVEGQMLWLGDKGIYSSEPGSGPVEIGLKINDLITENSGLILGNALAINDRIRQRYLVHIPSSGTAITLLFDYYNGGFWRWDGLDMSKGLALLGNTMYFVDAGGELQKEVTAYNDNAVAINAYYYSDWEVIEEPGSDKKIVNMRWYCLESSEVFTLTFQCQMDWLESALVTNASISINSAVQKSAKQHLNQNKVLSMRFLFSNNVLNQPLTLTKYEIEVEMTQRKMAK